MPSSAAIASRRASGASSGPRRRQRRKSPFALDAARARRPWRSVLAGAMAVPVDCARAVAGGLWRVRAWLAAAGALGSLGAAGFGAWSYAMDSGHFSIKTVEMRGGSPEFRAELLALAGLEKPERYNLMVLDAPSLAASLERHPRARRVDVKKIFPDTVAIEIEERRPAAILVGSTSFVIDRERLAIAQVEPDGWLRLKHLPLITGADEASVELGRRVEAPGLEAALRVWRALGLESPELAANVGEIRLSGHAGVDLVVRRGGALVRLGSKPDGRRLAALEALWKKNPGLKGLALVDLRFEGRAFLAEPAPKEPKERNRRSKR